MSDKLISGAEYMIDIRDVKKIYKMGENEVRALDGIDLKIKPNEFIAIIGPSGSGKSTLMNMIGCLDTPTEGDFYIDGNKASQLKDDEQAFIRNKKIGFIFQQYNLLPKLTVEENVELPLIYAGIPQSRRKEMTRIALERVDMFDRRKHKPSELSGGQRQRVAIARALINNPSIILADEPTGNLDTKTSVDIMNLFEQIHNNGNTVIVVTHEEDIARYAKRIIRLRDGKIESDTINN